MPDQSNRIRKTSFNAMNYILFLLNMINKRVDAKDYPKILVIFNDVSLRENSDHKERIKVYKNGLKDFVKDFYLQDIISDTTQFGEKIWQEIKTSVCSDERL